MLVISLTSIPPRFAQLPHVVASLREQADRVIVTLPQTWRRFPGTHPPPDLQGAELLRPETDPGPAAKVLSAARMLRGMDCDILYCDDDWNYAQGWAQTFRDARKKHPKAVLAGSTYPAKRLGLSGPPIAQGFAGVMIRPGDLDDIALSPPPEAWAVDDIWLSGAFARAGREMVELTAARALATPLDDPGNLQDARIGGMSRDQANRACAALMAERYGIWA